jgi:hypothetical protein
MRRARCPYFTKFRALDMLGLNDRHIATHRPEDLGLGVVAHELGDGEYVLSRKPDLVVFHLPHGYERAWWRSGKEMERTSEFKRFYQFVRYETLRPRRVGRVWVRREDSRVGIVRRDSTVTIPGYLFSAYKGSVATLDGQGRAGWFCHGNQP